MHKPIAITMGDPGGIGPEVVLKCYLKSLESVDSQRVMQNTFIVGDLAHLERARESLGASSSRLLQLVQIRRINDVFSEKFAKAQTQGVKYIPVLDVDCLDGVGNVPDDDPSLVSNSGAPSSHSASSSHMAPIAKISAEAGKIAAANIFWAARACLRDEVAALVTAPIHKQSLVMGGIDFPGHTEMLQFVAAQHCAVPISELPVRMMLASAELRVVLVSIHLSLRAAIEQVTGENILQTLKITHESLSKVLGRPPRIAVAGLNPHSGEGGLMGREEKEIIEPAIAKAKSLMHDLDVDGPFAPDTVFMKARTGTYDVVIAMYHDQGLIPIKYMGLDQGVNVTLGLPLVRTSPDHGTAFEIAGKGIADPASMWASVELARTLSE